VIPVQLSVAPILGWLQQEQHEIILYLREENRVLKAQLRHRRLRLTDSGALFTDILDFRARVLATESASTTDKGDRI
jgi:hypothetical protein